MADTLELYARHSLDGIYASNECRTKCYELIKDIRGETAVFNGKNPRGLAAAVVYAACVQSYFEKTQLDVAESLDIGTPTLSKHFKHLRQYFNARARRTNN